MDKIVFDYDAFFKRMKKDPKKRETALKYELLFGSQDGLTVEDQPFYKDYLSQFVMPFQVAIPDEGDFDWGLLLSFIFGSFYSEYTMTLEEEWKQNPIVLPPMIQLAITVHFEGQSVCKFLDELFDIQIHRLFEIYADEQINSAVIRQEEGGEEVIDSQRERRVSLYKKKSLLVAREVKTHMALMELISTL